MYKYYEQLTSECANGDCMRIFCRRHYSAGVVDEIVRILTTYSDIFHCGNIEKLLGGGVKAVYSYPIVDLYFYVDSLFYSSTVGERVSARGFSLKKIKTQKQMAEKGGRKNALKNFETRPCQELEHSYCSIINKSLSQVDLYLLIGITHLLLRKFQKIKNFNTGLIIIRLFVVISKTSCLDQSYYRLLQDVYDFVYKKLISSIINFHLVEPSFCSHPQCLFQLKFSKCDFENSVEIVSSALNASIITNIRENAKMRSLLEIFRILYKINESVGFFSYERFYLGNFCSKMNLKTEFKFLRSNCDTALSYGFILPIHTKAEILKMGNSDVMKSSLQDAFFRSLFEGVTEPYLFLAIKRDCIYRDTLEIIKELCADDLKKQLKIKFVDEEGIDSGGIRKEYFQLLSHEIASDKDLFTFKNNRIWIRKGDNLRTFNLVGKIIGMALYNDVVLNIPFPFLFFKKMLNNPLEFDDLAEIEPEIHRSILNLEKCSDEELRSSDLFFTVDHVEDGVHRIEELVPGCAGISVTKKNFKAFKKAYSEFYMVRLIEKEFDAFLSGFNTIINHETITRLRPKELEKIIIGLDEFDFDTIRATTAYNGYTKDARIIRDFWCIFGSYNLAYKKKLLQFITGNDRLPVAGSKSLQLTIIRNGCDTERLPSSQTCFNTLLLPDYASKEKLAKKLSKAIKLTAGFFLI